MNVTTAATASKSPKLLSSQFLPSASPRRSSLRKGITTQLTYIPLSPRLQALASPGPCTPFSLEDGVDYIANAHQSQEKLDAAFARHRAGTSERRTYSSVLASQR